MASKKTTGSTPGTKKKSEEPTSQSRERRERRRSRLKSAIDDIIEPKALAPIRTILVRADYETSIPTETLEDDDDDLYSNSLGVDVSLIVPHREYVGINVHVSALRQKESEQVGAITMQFAVTCKVVGKIDDSETLEAELKAVPQLTVWPRFCAAYEMLTGMTYLPWPPLPDEAMYINVQSETLDDFFHQEEGA